MKVLFRRGGIGAVWVVLACASVLGPMLLAARPAPPLAIGFARGAGFIDAGPDGPASFSPLSPKLLTELLGREAAARLLDGPPDAEPPPPTPAGHGPGPAPSPPPDDGGLTPPGQLTKSADLRIVMTVDKSEARPGDTLTYVITVTNVGEGVAKNVEVTSHTPEHTTLKSFNGCGVVTIDPSGDGRICVLGNVSGPGPHGMRAGRTTLGAGQVFRVTFEVVVNPDAAAGTIIRNHAHADALGEIRLTSKEVSTEVAL